MFGLFRVINNRYTHYYRREQEKLIKENKRKIDMMQFKQNEEIMRIKNEQLEDNIEQKNKEFAISTMAMIKKNQFLNLRSLYLCFSAVRVCKENIVQARPTKTPELCQYNQLR